MSFRRPGSLDDLLHKSRNSSGSGSNEKVKEITPTKGFMITMFLTITYYLVILDWCCKKCYVKLCHYYQKCPLTFEHELFTAYQSSEDEEVSYLEEQPQKRKRRLASTSLQSSEIRDMLENEDPDKANNPEKKFFKSRHSSGSVKVRSSRFLARQH